MAAKSNGEIYPMGAYEPTVALELLMITDAINAAEGIDVTIVNIHGVFFSAPLPEDEIVHIVSQGQMVEFIVKTEPKLYGLCLVKGPNG